MTRKRSGKTLIQKLTQTCPICKGYGFTKSVSTEGYAILRKLKEELAAQKIDKEVHLMLSPCIFDYLTTVQYNAILQFEKEYHCKITLISNEKYEIYHYTIEKV